MWPGAAVSGYYLWNPDSHYFGVGRIGRDHDVARRGSVRVLPLEPGRASYFGVGRIGRDQLADYAARKGVPLAEAERWLAPNLADD